ncbi:US2 [Human alphaherpesvirus 2]|uniref:US2 n=1 Tax=Human herpesvirus 2 TaxID=10310 RepID=A0A0Y0QP29_HHV2|nr:virion protein US2 [Human alphaherpesvirus 2]AQZ59158.1 virion protein US2 [Human alphaherpesvirus 2]ATD86335.1 US2 [Human alphaherpesvirus 2]ATD86644.1 US2 [Human alphaherpesvirus 2]QBH75890.1 US2 [Human alphaherpesvirus 2]
MGVVVVSVVTLLDQRNALPRTSADASPALWSFLLRQCRILASEPLGTPVVVRPANLRRLAEPLMDLPKFTRPIVRTRSCRCPPNTTTGLFAEDDPLESIEILDAPACFRLLHQERPGPHRLYHLWVVGAADLCVPFFEYAQKTRLGFRFIAMKTTDAWVGEPWPLPDRFLPERTVSWTPFPAAPNHPLENLLSRYEYQYGVVVPGPGDRERSCLRWLRSLVAPHNKPRPASSRPHPATHPTQRPCFTCMGRPEIPDEPSWQTGDDDPQNPGPPLAVGDEWPPSSHVCYPITNL